MKMSSEKRAIDKIYKRRDRYDIPEWQRQKVWSRAKKQNLIDSILRGWRLPKFYFLRLSDKAGTFEVVDGQQRLNAIFEFYDNELPLADPSAKEFGGHYYEDLPDNVSDAYDDFEIQYDLIDEASDEDVKQFFQRLQDGLPLTSSEKLNSISSKLGDFVRSQVSHSLFDRIPASDKRYGHFDILAKSVAIELEGIDVGLRYDELRAVFESHSTFSSRSKVANRIRKALDLMESGFSDTQIATLRNRTVVQSVMTFVCRLIETGVVEDTGKAVAEFIVGFVNELRRQVELGSRASDTEYIEFQRSVNANVKAGPQTRNSILLRKYLQHKPSMAQSPDLISMTEEGLRTSIRADSARIAQLVSDINTIYAAKNGGDLFKSTNRTTRALTRLAAPIRNFEDYEKMVDDLYFLFWESAGSRLSKKEPDSFGDIRDLRTDLRHDTDHGKRSAIRAKRKKTGRVFAKYAGSPSPVGLSPERFIVVQSNLLVALRTGLTQLKGEMI